MSSDLPVHDDGLTSYAEPDRAMHTDGDAAVLVHMIGAPGSGKSRLARRHFRADQVRSLDHWRRELSGTAADQGATQAAVAMMCTWVEWRTDQELVTVVDATHTLPAYRARTAVFARDRGIPVAAFVLHTSPDLCVDRRQDEATDAAGVSPAVPEHIVRKLAEELTAHPPTLTEYDLIVHVSPDGRELLYEGTLPMRVRAGAPWWFGLEALGETGRTWPFLWELHP